MNQGEPERVESNELLDRLRKSIAGSRRRLLGQMVLGRGWISTGQLEDALRIQREENRPGRERRLGEVLLGLNWISKAQLFEVLTEQDHSILEGLAPDGSDSPPNDILKIASDPERCLDQYVLIERIGQGGMGEVWKAWDRELNRWVAVKVLKAEDRQAAERFMREARLAGGLSHPGIVTVHAVGEKRGAPFIVMQYVKEAAREKSPLPPRDAARIVRDAALAIHYAHEQGVIHRDLKPANLLINRMGRVFVSDFGLARKLEAPPGKTYPGTVLGTPNYMSPEQARGDSEGITGSVDVFSLGATLYELVTGRPPYLGKTPNEVLVKAVRGEFPSVRSVRSKLHRDLEIVIQKAMESEPTHRYSAAGLARDLKLYLDGEAILARPRSLLYRTRKRVRKNPWAWGLGLSAILAVVLGAMLIGDLIRRGGVDQEFQRLLTKVERRYANGDFPGTHELAVRARGLKPDHPEPRYWLARLRIREYQVLRGVPEARIVRGLVEILPPRPETIEERQLREKIKADLETLSSRPIIRGILALLERDTESSLEHFGAVSEGSTSFREAQIYSAIAHYLDGDFEKAKELLSRYRGSEADLILPILCRTYTALAQEREGRGRLQEAKELYLGATALAIEIEKELGDDQGKVLRATALVAWGKMEQSQGVDPEKRFDEAESHVAALNDAPGHGARGDARLARAMYRESRGKLDWKEPPEYRAAIEAYSAALKLDPKDGSFFLRRGEARMALLRYQSSTIGAWTGQLTQILGDFQRALNLNPDYVDGALGLNSARMKFLINTEAEPERKRRVLHEVIGSIEDIIRAHPKHSRAHAMLGHAFAELGRVRYGNGENGENHMRSALRNLDRAIRFKPKDVESYLGRGIIRLKFAKRLSEYSGEDPADMLGAAIDDFRAATEINPQNAEAYALLAEGYQNNGVDLFKRGGDFDEQFRMGAGHIETSIRINAHRADTRLTGAVLWSTRGLVRARSGRSPEADYQKSLQFVDSAIRIKPLYSPSYAARSSTFLYQALYYAQIGRDPGPALKNAVRDGLHAAKIAPLDPKAMEAAATALNNRGLHRRRSGEDPRRDYEEALSFVDRAIGLDRGDSVSYELRAAIKSNLAAFLSRTGRDPTLLYKGAIIDVSKAIGINPRSSELSQHRGTYRMSWGTYILNRGGNPMEQYALAAKDLKQAIKLNSRNGSAWRVSGKIHNSIGAFLFRQGKSLVDESRTALAHFDRAIQIDANDIRSYQDRATTRFNLGFLETSDEKLREEYLRGSAEDCSRVLETRPEDVKMILLRGKALAAAGRVEAAIEDFKRVIDLQPSHRKKMEERIRRLKEK